MNVATPPPVPREKSYRPWILLTVSFLVVTVPLLILLSRFVNYRSANADAVAALKAKINANHEPLTLEELAATYPPIPAAENGADVLLQMWEKEDPVYWRAFLSGSDSLPEKAPMQFDKDLPLLGSRTKHIDRLSALPAAGVAAGHAYLDAQKERLATVRTALGYQRFRFPVRMAAGFSRRYPHRILIKREAITFQIEGLLAAERGDVDGAIASLEDAAKMGKTLASEPLRISQMVRVGCYIGVMDVLQRLLSRQALSTNQLARVDALVDQLKIPGAFRMALVAERAADMTLFDLPPEKVAQAILPDESVTEETARSFRITFNAMSVSGFRDADRRVILETLTEAIALAERDDPKSLRQCEQMFSNAVVRASQLPPKFFSTLLLSSLEIDTKRFAALEARRRAAKLAIGIERYRMIHNGNLPRQLELLAPEFIAAVPKDPFNGELLRLKPLPTGFVVYSVGADRVDNDAKEEEWPSGAVKEGTDETFVIER